MESESWLSTRLHLETTETQAAGTPMRDFPDHIIQINVDGPSGGSPDKRV